MAHILIHTVYVIKILHNSNQYITVLFNSVVCSVFQASPSPLSECSPQSPFHLGPFHSSPCQSSPLLTPTLPSPQSSPSSASSSPIPRPPSNGHHRPPPVPLKGHLQSKNHSSKADYLLFFTSNVIAMHIIHCLVPDLFCAVL